MGVDAVDSIHGRVKESPADIWAAKLAEKLDEMRKAASSAHESPNVTTSASYTPAVVAQAASYQVYTQTGTIAALSSGLAAPVLTSTHDHPDDIKAVDGANGATVNTLA